MRYRYGHINKTKYDWDSVLVLVLSGVKTKHISAKLNIPADSIFAWKCHNRKLWETYTKEKEVKYINSVTFLCPKCGGKNHKDNKICIYCEVSL